MKLLSPHIHFYSNDAPRLLSQSKTNDVTQQYFADHSTGEHIWGVPTSFITKVARRLDDRIAGIK